MEVEKSTTLDHKEHEGGVVPFESNNLTSHCRLRIEAAFYLKARKSIRKARRSFANYKTKMTSLRRPDGTVTASRRAMEKVIYDFYSDLFNSRVYLPTHHLR
uniref:DUF4817 domain-containing protein n=1 Tax=Haemonchus contortus TaxID=6289 RepID=A0A7I4YX68_HAECO